MEYNAYVCYSVVKIQGPNKSHAMIKRNENETVVWNQLTRITLKVGRGVGREGISYWTTS